MAKYRVVVEVQFALQERAIMIEAESAAEAGQLATAQVDEAVCNEDFGSAEVVYVGALTPKLIQPYPADQ